MFTTEDECGVLIVIPLRPAQDQWEEELETVQPETEWLLRRLGDPPRKNVVVDLANIPLLRSNSNLLASIIVIWKHLMAAGKTMSLCNVSPKALEVLNTAKLNTLWSICSSRNEALAKFRM